MITDSIVLSLQRALEPYAAYFSVNLHKFLAAIGEHFWLSGGALLIATVAGVSFGVLCARNKTVNLVISGVFFGGTDHSKPCHPFSLPSLAGNRV
ncbi:MAG: hypothetical protein LBG27_13205 [Spirochaetaceae bacterium]|jgi:ABC-type proline/glycine betaine transport system permease subunit|nr:hypothetical protein [Spirochaetaceae bacterium]